MNIMPVIPNIKVSTSYRPKFGNNPQEMPVRHENTCENFWNSKDCYDNLLERKREILRELRENSEELKRLSNICPCLNTDDCDCIPVMTSIKEYQEDIKNLKEELGEINSQLGIEV